MKDGSPISYHVSVFRQSFLLFFPLVCSKFVGAISSQHLCVPRCDCMGIVCTLQMPTAHKLTSLQIGFYLNLEDTRLEILFNNNLFLMEADGTYKLFFIICLFDCRKSNLHYNTKTN